MKLPAPCQLDLFAELPADAACAPPPSATVVAFPTARRHALAREMAARMARTPPEHRDRVWRRHTSQLMRDRIAAGLTRDAALEDLRDYTATVRRLAAYLGRDAKRSGS